MRSTSRALRTLAIGVTFLVGAFVVALAPASAFAQRGDDGLGDALRGVPGRDDGRGESRGDIITGRGLKSDPDWTDMPPGIPDTYTVTQGDTLWSICGRILGNPWFWRKVAEINPQLKSPDWIYPGDTIRFRPGAQLPAPGEAPPPVPVGDAGDGASMGGAEGAQLVTGEFDFDDTEEEGGASHVRRADATFARVREELIREQFTYANIRQEGYLADNEDTAVGLIANSPLNKVMMTQGDMVYLYLNEPQNWRPGTTFQIFRSIRKISHPRTGENMGIKFQVVGEVQILPLSSEDADARAIPARIVNAYAEIERGDLLQVPTPLKVAVPSRRSPTPIEGVIVDRFSEAAMVRQGMLIYLDQGMEDGMEAGLSGYIYKRGDGLTTVGATGDTYKEEEFPRFRIAEFVVLRTFARTSIGYVTTAMTEAAVGDDFMIPGAGGTRSSR